MENLTVDEPNGIFDNVKVNTVAEGYDTHGHPSQESVVIVDAEKNAIDELDIIHDSSKTMIQMLILMMIMMMYMKVRTSTQLITQMM